MGVHSPIFDKIEKISFRVDDDELKFIQAKMKVISMLIVLCFFRKIESILKFV